MSKPKQLISKVLKYLPKSNLDKHSDPITNIHIELYRHSLPQKRVANLKEAWRQVLGYADFRVTMMHDEFI